MLVFFVGTIFRGNKGIFWVVCLSGVGVKAGNFSIFFLCATVTHLYEGDMAVFVCGHQTNLELFPPCETIPLAETETRLPRGQKLHCLVLFFPPHHSCHSLSLFLNPSLQLRAPAWSVHFFNFFFSVFFSFLLYNSICCAFPLTAWGCFVVELHSLHTVTLLLKNCSPASVYQQRQSFPLITLVFLAPKLH